MPLYMWGSAASLAAATVIVFWLVGAQLHVVDRVARGNLQRGSSLTPVDLREIQLTSSARERLIAPAVSTLSRYARRLTPGGWVASLERRVVLAGKGARWPLDRLLAVKLLLGLTAFLALLRPALVGPGPGPIALALGAGITGFFLPDGLLYGRARDRQERIERELPDVLDQITISVEAGMGFEAAMARAGKEGDGPLADELTRTLQDIHIGIGRGRALDHLLERTDASDVRHFVLAIRQAERYGLPIAQVLRVQAAEVREKRRQRAEERAMKVPVKIVFPVVICIFPAMFIALMGPAVIRIWHTFGA